MLYVTDLHVTYGSPTGVLEHLSCFLPGLFALGAHLLPLDNLHSLGINYLGLAAKFSPRDREGYKKLSKFNLRELHMWAAKGLTETCYLTYADQPSGLGPEEVLFVDGGVRWVDMVEKWRKRGGRGPVPGLRRKDPVVVPLRESETQYQKHVQMDYWVRAGAYLLRPEVGEHVSGNSEQRRLTAFDRLWNHFTFYGGRQGNPVGESTLGRSLSPSKNIQRPRAVTLPLILIRMEEYSRRMRCRGT